MWPTVWREEELGEAHDRLVDRNRMSQEAQVRFWEGLGTKVKTINLVDIQDFFTYPQ
jgi:hypothetical protein